MAIAITSPNPGPSANSGVFILNAISADASGCEELKAAPAVGISIIVDKLVINNGASAISITIGEAETTPGSVDAALIGPIAMAVNTSIQFDFSRAGGMMLTAAKSLVVDASGAGAVCIFATGRVE